MDGYKRNARCRERERERERESMVPGEIKRSRDLRGGRWSWTFKFAQKRS